MQVTAHGSRDGSHKAETRGPTETSTVCIFPSLSLCGKKRKKSKVFAAKKIECLRQKKIEWKSSAEIKSTGKVAFIRFLFFGSSALFVQNIQQTSTLGHLPSVADYADTPPQTSLQIDRRRLRIQNSTLSASTVTSIITSPSFSLLSLDQNGGVGGHNRPLLLLANAKIRLPKPLTCHGQILRRCKHDHPASVAIRC
jgi:hypothetical protein